MDVEPGLGRRLQDDVTFLQQTNKHGNVGARKVCEQSAQEKAAQKRVNKIEQGKGHNNFVHEKGVRKRCWKKPQENRSRN